MTPKGKERLLKLAEILDVADAEHRKNKEPTYEQNSFAHDCDTPACALGHWAANNRRRLEWRPNRFPQIVRRSDGYSAPFEIAQDEFDITEKEAVELFSSAGCGAARTAKQAARYIRQFVKRVERGERRLAQLEAA